jgi:hypothetical protein
MDDDSRQIILDETTWQARSMMDELAQKFMWDVFFHLMNPDEATLDRILNAIAKTAVDRIREDVAEDSKDEDLDADDMEFVTTLTDEAIQKAFTKFKDNHANPILTDDFAHEVMRAMSINITRIAATESVDEEEGSE